MITLLFATLITIAKFLHDIGKAPKYVFITIMLGSVYYLTENIYASLMFLLPLIPYSAGTGSMHKAHPSNTKNDYAECKPIDWLVFRVIGKPPLTPNDSYRQSYGGLYCLITTLIFCINLFAYAVIFAPDKVFFAYIPMLLLFVWPLVVEQVKWEWAVSYLFFCYSFGFLCI